MPDYQLHSLSEDGFEKLVYHLCLEILGIGTVAFAKGPDGGPIRFHSQDIKQVILAFRGKSTASSSEGSETREYVGMDRKNEINNLRKDDFNFITENSEPYFEQIKELLGDPINEEIAILYRDFAAEINHKVHLRRDDFSHFGEIFEHLYNKVTSDEPELRPRELVWVFLHFMYVHCDLGRK